MPSSCNMYGWNLRIFSIQFWEESLFQFLVDCRHIQSDSLSKSTEKFKVRKQHYFFFFSFLKMILHLLLMISLLIKLLFTNVSDTSKITRHLLNGYWKIFRISENQVHWFVVVAYVQGFPKATFQSSFTVPVFIPRSKINKER